MQYVSLHIKCYKALWKSNVVSMALLAFLRPRFSPFMNNLVATEDSQSVKGYTVYVLSGVAETYLMIMGWGVILEFDVVLTTICHSISLCLRKIRHDLTSESGFGGRGEAVENGLDRYKSLHSLVLKMNVIYSLTIAIQKAIAIVIMGISLYAMLNMSRSPVVFYLFCNMFVSFNFKILVVFIPVGLIVTESKRVVGSVMGRFSQTFTRRTAFRARALRREMRCLRNLRVFCWHFYTITPTAVLAYLSFVTSYMVMFFES